MFNNLKIAFSDKSNRDLNRAYILFKTISNPLISSILTVLVKTAIWIHLPINFIIRRTIYEHFCGGTTIKDSQNTINKLWRSNIGTILDFSAEGQKNEADFNMVMDETIASIIKAKDNESIPFAVFKPTGLIRFSLLEKISNNKKLSTKQKKEKENFEIRVENICNMSYINKVPVFIDAEESWIQDAIDIIAIKMMQKFNKDRAWIFNTIQFYRNDRIEHLENLIDNAEKNNFIIGIKLVRGAYHRQEMERAEKMGYPCPVHQKKEKTDRDYDKGLRICINNMHIVSLCAGTHNESSSALLVHLIEQQKISKKDKRFYFSQLLGMSDHISYNLAKKGFNVAKYVPYGPIKNVLPYLIRRAEENTSIAGQMGRELINITAEKERRKKN